LTGKPEGKEHVGDSSLRRENKTNVHLKMCKEIAWNAFNWLKIRIKDGTF
jgi:hypothetical protein